MFVQLHKKILRKEEEKEMKRKARHKTSRRQRKREAQIRDIVKLTVDLSKMTVATSAGLALMKGSREALKK